eukprot:gene44-biopygen2123
MVRGRRPCPVCASLTLGVDQVHLVCEPHPALRPPLQAVCIFICFVVCHLLFGERDGGPGGKGVEEERRAEGSGICSLLQLCSRSLAGRIAYGAGRIAVGVGRVAVGTGRIAVRAGRIAMGATRAAVGAGRIAVRARRTALRAGRIAGGEGGSEMSCDCLATVSR